ncbi:MAG: amino acid ABC transporter permease [Turicibacter sanguinis]|jgi:amino ABC transporter, permease protein, 3-TM region, his/glu/gln/arg/opine family|uniref:amino acid ABC transporter permease n=1 Tax=Turicibacter TaxID=191303 RepID=UPI0001FD99BB|nr:MULTISPECIES: amino acid ABC transporter permease [Turicibacter]EGC93453.1 ABC transporter, permease protein [Turicibacter sp. HGF1]MBP3902762.1 amino acid ABC transporter permease [Turicibacter sp.]MCU7195463.1 amino acid ABC transporter permease [Turicibacter sanguinis]MCU7201645.1 amino acid ABC transporter permease [Turicibacter sanguinis]MDB8436412.1 amino acid ABC transporter permease [Turicibacter sanguinis]
MDFQFIKTYAPMYVEAAKLTMSIALLGILLSTLVGFICCLIRYYKIPILQRVIGMYIELSRNTPLLIQLFFLYFGLPKLGIFLSSYACGVLGLTFLGGSYMAEAFRSGLESIPDIQMESGLSLGLTKWQVLCYIIFPQAVAVSLPAFSANVIFLIKETSVFSVVALADLMYVAKGLIGLYYKTDESLLMLVVAYLVLLLPISLILSVIEKKVRYGGVGN